MFIHYTIQTQQNRHSRRPQQATTSTPAADPGPASTSTLPPRRPAGREYGTHDSFLPIWFSEEARQAPPSRFSPGSKAKLTEEVAFLRENKYLPSKTYGDLLIQTALLAEVKESARYAQELEHYQELSGLQQFFTLKPYKNRILTMLNLDFSRIEEQYHDKREQAKVFCAMTELHDMGFVRLRGKYPYIVSITPLGKDVLDRLEAEPPVYRQLDKPPEYELNTQA